LRRLKQKSDGSGINVLIIVALEQEVS